MADERLEAAEGRARVCANFTDPSMTETDRALLVSEVDRLRARVEAQSATIRRIETLAYDLVRDPTLPNPPSKSYVSGLILGRLWDKVGA